MDTFRSEVRNTDLELSISDFDPVKMMRVEFHNILSFNKKQFKKEKQIKISLGQLNYSNFTLGLHNIAFFYHHRNMCNKHIAKDCNTTIG